MTDNSIPQNESPEKDLSRPYRLLMSQEADDNSLLAFAGSFDTVDEAKEQSVFCIHQRGIIVEMATSKLVSILEPRRGWWDIDLK